MSTLTLSPALAARIEALTERTHLTTAEEVVAAGVKLLEEWQADFEALVGPAMDELDRGEGMSIEEAFADMRAHIDEVARRHRVPA